MTRVIKTEEQMQDQEVARVITSFLTVQAANWKGRQLNQILPRVLHAIDEARSAGHAVDVPALVKQVYLERTMPLPEVE